VRGWASGGVKVVKVVWLDVVERGGGGCRGCVVGGAGYGFGKSVREGAEILVWEVSGGVREVDGSREISARRFGWLGG
jgi:hypothetical protein